MPLDPNSTSFPSALDVFPEAGDGQTPGNLVRAYHLNRVNNALIAVERETQYTAQTAGATGQTIYVIQTSLRLASSLPEPGLNLSIPFTVDAAVANQWFGGNPFDRSYGLISSAKGYRISGGIKDFIYTRTAVNCQQERGSLTCYVNVLKQDRWRRNDYCDAELMIIRP